MKIKELLSEDMDYGPYRGHPGDPRTPEPSDIDQEHDKNVEIRNQLEVAVKSDIPLTRVDVDTLEYLKTFDPAIESLDTESVQEIMYDALNELNVDIAEYEKNVARSQEPDYE